MAPLVLCALSDSGRVTAVADARRWLASAGFETTFAYMSGGRSGASYLLRIRGGTAHTAVPAPKTLSGAEALDAITRAIDVARAACITGDADIHVVGGNPRRALEALAEQIDAELIVLGSTRRPSEIGRWPTLLARGRSLGDGAGPIICAVGNASDRTIRTASLLARQLSRPLLLAHVVPTAAARSGGAQRLERIARDVAVDMTAQTVVLQGDVADEVERLAQRTSADLIVVGTGDHGGPGARLRRSTTRRLLTRSARPFVIVPPSEEDGASLTDWRLGDH